jgi:hypothetical protein
MIRFKLVATLLAAVMALVSSGAQAETITFRIKSDYQYKVQVAFYSQARNHVWPGPGEAYNLDDDDVKSYPLSCRPGESICYGAWPTGSGSKWWGVGPNNQNRCSTCCYTCGEGDVTPVISLE